MFLLEPTKTGIKDFLQKNEICTLRPVGFWGCRPKPALGPHCMRTADNEHSTLGNSA